MKDYLFGPKFSLFALFLFIVLTSLGVRQDWSTLAFMAGGFVIGAINNLTLR